jgi:hypothetical protein
VDVNHGGFQAFVAELLLNGADVFPGGEDVTGPAVAKDVGRGEAV